MEVESAAIKRDGAIRDSGQPRIAPLDLELNRQLCTTKT